MYFGYFTWLLLNAWLLDLLPLFCIKIDAVIFLLNSYDMLSKRGCIIVDLEDGFGPFASYIGRKHVEWAYIVVWTLPGVILKTTLQLITSFELFKRDVLGFEWLETLGYSVEGHAQFMASLVLNHNFNRNVRLVRALAILNLVHQIAHLDEKFSAVAKLVYFISQLLILPL